MRECDCYTSNHILYFVVGRVITYAFILSAGSQSLRASRKCAYLRTWQWQMTFTAAANWCRASHNAYVIVYVYPPARRMQCVANDFRDRINSHNIRSKKKKREKKHTLTSLKLSASVANVEFTTDGLFLTLGKIMPPFLDAAGFVAVPLPCGMALMFGPAVAPLRLTFTVTVLLLLPVGVVDGNVVIGSGGSVKSSKIENLLMKKPHI